MRSKENRLLCAVHVHAGALLARYSPPPLARSIIGQTQDKQESHRNKAPRASLVRLLTPSQYISQLAAFEDPSAPPASGGSGGGCDSTGRVPTLYLACGCCSTYLIASAVERIFSASASGISMANCGDKRGWAEMVRKPALSGEWALRARARSHERDTQQAGGRSREAGGSGHSGYASRK